MGHQKLSKGLPPLIKAFEKQLGDLGMIYMTHARPSTSHHLVIGFAAMIV
jgi:hypothetical protein